MKNYSNMKKCIIIVLIGVFSYWALNNLKTIGNVLLTILNVLFPFILGGIIAFILNIPMKKIERILRKKIKKKGVARMISIILSLLLFVVIILVILFLLIPQLIDNIKMLIDSFPLFIEKIKTFMIDLANKYPDLQAKVQELLTKNIDIKDVVSNVLNYFVHGAVGFIGNTISGFATFFTAVIFSVYMLSQKEYLIRGSKKILYAINSKEKANKIINIGNMINNTFSKFLTGQCLEAVILGCLMFVALSIFRFPYVLLISVLTSVTALIPVFGAFIACGIGFILIAISNPVQALLFIVVFLIVQQIEGNFIYPRVVGKSVGLSPIWTLLAVTVGGGLFGIVGMLVGLPIASVIYTIIKDVVNNKLKEKDISVV